ncbi:MAG: hypothetical protein HYY10_04220 [Candidatus Liptonbacteria bacterium]|nr:hypothetical protein [Candidatus Liptonbacteria bacterium]
MLIETRSCQNCKNQFVIEPEDFDFYKKMCVPPPTFCPDCRAQRRMLWRNERTYYKRPCNAPGHSEGVISIIAPESPFVIFDQQYWWSDSWDPLDAGRDLDFSKPFFKQYRELLERVPIIALSNTNSVNSDYCSSAAWNKDCYLISGGGWDERVSYANRAVKVKDSLDVYIVDNSELCYDCSYCTKCYRLLMSRNCEACSESAFLYNCRNCSSCFGCANLRSKQYCFFNEQLTKEEYERRVRSADIGSFRALQGVARRFHNCVYLKAIHKYADIMNCTNATGDHIRNARNCRDCFDIGGDDTEHCRFVNWSGFKTKDLYDTGPGAGWNSEMLYEGLDLNDSSRLVGCVTNYNCQDMWYCVNCHNSSDCFGCYGLRSKQHCILNKQYSEEEYKALLSSAKEHMEKMPYIDAQGRRYGLGEFFPPEIQPFAYNETIAQEYFPLTKEVATRQGHRWREQDARHYTVTLHARDVPDHIKDVSDDILREIIECEHAGACLEQCTTAFKIIPGELQLYRRLGIPLPHLCPNCRHYQRLAQRNSLKLWHRQCMCNKSHREHSGQCLNEFETSYAPERPEIVYCEQCYQQEIS